MVIWERAPDLRWKSRMPPSPVPPDRKDTPDPRFSHPWPVPLSLLPFLSHFRLFRLSPPGLPPVPGDSLRLRPDYPAPMAASTTTAATPPIRDAGDFSLRPFLLLLLRSDLHHLPVLDGIQKLRRRLEPILRLQPPVPLKWPCPDTPESPPRTGIPEPGCPHPSAPMTRRQKAGKSRVETGGAGIHIRVWP